MNGANSLFVFSLIEASFLFFAGWKFKEKEKKFLKSPEKRTRFK